jgi:hypothetical protein
MTRRTNGLSPASIQVENKKSVTSNVDKSSKNPKASNIWCHYGDKKSKNTADCRGISKFKKLRKAWIDAKSGFFPSFSKKLMHPEGSCKEG